MLVPASEWNSRVLSLQQLSGAVDMTPGELLQPRLLTASTLQ